MSTTETNVAGYSLRNKMSFWSQKKVLVTGASGFVGSNLLPQLKDKNCKEIITFRSSEYDLTKPQEVSQLFARHNPDLVIHLAGKVGGILANRDYCGDFFFENIMMGTLVMECARLNGVEKVVSLAAGCGYPQHLTVPFKEDDFWSGLPDNNTRGYSMAKKNLIIQSEAYRQQYGFNSCVLLPANLYGPYDNFDLTSSHVLPALVRKFIEGTVANSPEVVVWGSGNASREFLYVEDTATAILDVCEKYNESAPLNLGTGVETTIRELVDVIKEETGYEGEVVWDTTKPDGQKRRFYDMSKYREKIGRVPNTSVREGVRRTINWYKRNILHPVKK